MQYVTEMVSETPPHGRDEVTLEITRECLLTRTRRISRVLTGIYDQALRPFGINSPQFTLLVVIARLGPVNRTSTPSPEAGKVFASACVIAKSNSSTGLRDGAAAFFVSMSMASSA